MDEIVIYQTEKDLMDLLMLLPINVRFLGEEYKGKPFTGKTICHDRGIKLHYNTRSHEFSTTELRDRTYYAELERRSES